MERSTTLEITHASLVGSCPTTLPSDQAKGSPGRPRRRLSERRPTSHGPWDPQCCPTNYGNTVLTPAATGRLRTRQLSGNPNKGSMIQNSQKREEGTHRGSAFLSIPCLWVCRTHGEHALRCLNLPLHFLKMIFSVIW